MKVYIAVDSEGEACVVRERRADGTYGTWQAEFIREQATREAAAAVEGARDGGAAVRIARGLSYAGAGPDPSRAGQRSDGWGCVFCGAHG